MLLNYFRRLISFLTSRLCHSDCSRLGLLFNSKFVIFDLWNCLSRPCKCACKRLRKFSAIYPICVLRIFSMTPQSHQGFTLLRSFEHLKVYGWPFYELLFGTQFSDVQGLNLDGFWLRPVMTSHNLYLSCYCLKVCTPDVYSKLENLWTSLTL